MPFYSAIAEGTRSELLQAAIDNNPVVINSTSTENVTILAGRAGFKAAVIGWDLTGAHADDEAKFSYGSSPTDLSGKIVDGAVTDTSKPTDEVIYAAPDGEDLKLSTTVTTSITGIVQVSYIKNRA